MTKDGLWLCPGACGAAARWVESQRGHSLALTSESKVERGRRASSFTNLSKTRSTPVPRRVVVFKYRKNIGSPLRLTEAWAHGSRHVSSAHLHCPRSRQFAGSQAPLGLAGLHGAGAPSNMRSLRMGLGTDVWGQTCHLHVASAPQTPRAQITPRTDKSTVYKNRCLEC